MVDKNLKNVNNSLRVLIAPLDWGLGHATRCIPIIKELIKFNCTVYITGADPVIALLKKEFPAIVFLRSEGYKMTYTRNKRWLMFKIFLQLPKVLYSIWREHKWLKKIVVQHEIEAIISDNRLGMFTKNIPSIYITHQLFISTGNIFTEKIAQRIHYFFIKKYKECWIPDSEKSGLAGKLSHPKKTPGNVVYTGPLTRLTSLQQVETVYDISILLSGPEPQRTIFENQVLSQLNNFSGKVFFARGLPSEKNSLVPGKESIKVVNHLDGKFLNRIIAQSRTIIARCGYTTVMDLAALRKPAILIPTPGQTEQEYLAGYLLEKKYFLTASQENFSLPELLQKSAVFTYEPVDISFDEYKKTISQFVLSLKNSNFAFQ